MPRDPLEDPKKVLRGCFVTVAGFIKMARDSIELPTEFRADLTCTQPYKDSSSQPTKSNTSVPLARS